MSQSQTNLAWGHQKENVNSEEHALYKLYERSCHLDTCQEALNEISQHFQKRYKKVWRLKREKKENRMSRWVNASQVNWYFCIWATNTYLTKIPLTVSSIVAEMMVTRTTARKLISDCLGEGWLIKVENDDKRTFNYLSSHSFFMNWERYLLGMINKSEFDAFYKSLKTYEFCLDKLIKLDDENVQNMHRL